MQSNRKRVTVLVAVLTLRAAGGSVRTENAAAMDKASQMSESRSSLPTSRMQATVNSRD